MDSFLHSYGDNMAAIVLIVVSALLARLVGGFLIKKVFHKALVSTARVARATHVVLSRSRTEEQIRAAEARRLQRAETLVSVSLTVLTVVVSTIALVMILAQLGINVGPIVTSLGVAGLAAGIGAQTIIKDVIAGTVMLLEDIVAVGDDVDLGLAQGTVENVNLRVTQVRDAEGVLWSVRNGEIVSVGNRSRG